MKTNRIPRPRFATRPVQLDYRVNDDDDDAVDPKVLDFAIPTPADRLGAGLPSDTATVSANRRRGYSGALANALNRLKRSTSAVRFCRRAGPQNDGDADGPCNTVSSKTVVTPWGRARAPTTTAVSYLSATAIELYSYRCQRERPVGTCEPRRHVRALKRYRFVVHVAQCRHDNRSMAVRNRSLCHIV